MSDIAERPAFSKRMLDLGERAQHALGHSALGGRLVGVVAGSRSPAYRQLDWFSRDIEAEIYATASADGDPYAGRLPRNWHTAVVIATTVEELAKLEQKAGSRAYQPAVAYVAQNVVRVGVDPHDRGPLFGWNAPDERAVGMRLGRGPLEAAMGIWLPDDRAFVSTASVHVAHKRVRVSEFSPLSHYLNEVPLT